MGKGKASKKLLADQRRSKLEAWQKQAGGSGDAGSRIIVMWTSRQCERMGAIFLRAGEPDTASRPDPDAVLQPGLHAHVPHDAGPLGKDITPASPQKGPPPAGGQDKLEKLLVSQLTSHLDRADICPVQVRLEGPTRVQCSGVGSIPIKILLANSDWHVSLRVTFEALSSLSLPANGKVEYGLDYEWGGVQRKSLLVPPRGEVPIALTVTVMRVGVYNLNRFRLSFPTEGGKDVAAFPPLDFSTSTTFQRLLHVEPAVSS
eukprot:Tamp_03989.p3 GENE.Tamp_03989~~Tamp_03989.p3  ORF type:complete len:260 (-),score=36.10 Tamp_03989:2566-3345(-)